MNVVPECAQALARFHSKFNAVLDDGTPYRHPNAPISLVATKGRCVHFRLSGEPSWSDLAEELTRNGGPCEEFRLEGRDLYARLKTEAQLTADDAAFDIDEAHPARIGDWTLRTWGVPDFESKPAPKGKAEKDTRGKWEKALEKFIFDSGEETFTRLSMLETARDALAEKGQSIRLDNLNREFKKLIGRVIEEVADDEFRLKS